MAKTRNRPRKRGMKGNVMKTDFKFQILGFPVQKRTKETKYKNLRSPELFVGSGGKTGIRILVSVFCMFIKQNSYLTQIVRRRWICFYSNTNLLHQVEFALVLLKILGTKQLFFLNTRDISTLNSFTKIWTQKSFRQWWFLPLTQISSHRRTLFRQERMKTWLVPGRRAWVSMCGPGCVISCCVCKSGGRTWSRKWLRACV